MEGEEKQQTWWCVFMRMNRFVILNFFFAHFLFTFLLLLVLSSFTRLSMAVSNDSCENRVEKVFSSAFKRPAATHILFVVVFSWDFSSMLILGFRQTSQITQKKLV
jgi:hypothetical protein